MKNSSCIAWIALLILLCAPVSAQESHSKIVEPNWTDIGPPRFGQYRLDVHRQLAKTWQSAPRDSYPVCSVIIDHTGHVAYLGKIKASGSEEVDRRALAILEAAKFAPPPANLENSKRTASGRVRMTIDFNLVAALRLAGTTMPK